MTLFRVNQRGQRREKQALKAKSKALSRIKWYEWDTERIIHALKSNDLNAFEVSDLIRQKRQYTRDLRLILVLDQLTRWDARN
jgi:hypothetical protein